MRKIFLLLAILSFAASGRSQSYTFTNTTAAYQELSSPAVLSVGNWDDFDTTLIMPFMFVYFNDTIDNYLISEDGVYFGPWGLGQVTPFGQETQNRADTSPSVISQKVEGSSPNRILKIQYKNMGLFDSTASYPENFVNHQIWFYETSNRIELRYGSSNFNTNSSGIYDYRVGIMKADGSDGFYLYGNPATPSVDNDPDSDLRLNDYPASGTLYRFEPYIVNGVSEVSSYTRISVYPNPFSHQLWVDASATIESITVRDAEGKEVYTTEVNETSTALETQDWASGIYFIAIVTSEGTATHKVYK